MAENFTAKQKEIVARKMGYDGPMQMFDEYLASTPSDAQRYANVTSKFAERMAKGGMVFAKSPVKKFAVGGATTTKTTVVTPEVGAPTIPTAPGYTASTTEVTDAMKAKAPVTGDADEAKTKLITDTATVKAPDDVKADKITATTATGDIKAALKDVTAPQGTVDKNELAVAAQGNVSKKAVAEEQTFDTKFVKPIVSGTRDTSKAELVTAVTDVPTIKSQAAQTSAPEEVVAAQGEVKANELVDAAQIDERDMAQARAITSAGLSDDATVVAARLKAFTVDAGTLAEAAQGNVNAQSTVQGQLEKLMKSFDDGQTPAWAAGAMRAANAAMASRGLGGSSMAATAIFQAAMESALPIASQDSQTFAQMGLQNLNNRQQVSLANAAAQQGLSLANLNNEQQARLQNATNSFSLQSQNLSNMQQTMLANTQIRAALQGQNLSNRQQAAVVNAARYAEQANINLNNIQQTALHNSSMAVQVDIANTSNRQQTALANAQIEAAMQGKILDNRQQAAVLNAAKISENLNLTFTAKEQAALNNSQLMKDIGIANLSAAQQTAIANAATFATMDVANLNNRQQVAVQNAKAFLEMDMKNLDIKQQTALFKAKTIADSLTSDAGFKNAAAATNASNKLEADKISETLALTAQQYNAAEKNKMSVANMNAANELAKFNVTEANNRAEFNSRMSAEISVANAKILADVSTANTAAINAANAVNSKNATDLSSIAYTAQTQTYRDLLSYSFKAGESEKDRIKDLAVASIQKSATTAAADATSSAAWGTLMYEIIKGW